MKKNNGTKIKMFKGEKRLWTLLILLLACIPISIVFSKASLAKTSIEVSKLKNKIENQLSLNESLYMKINDLASLDNIQSIVKEKGLSYINDNIKIINNEE